MPWFILTLGSGANNPVNYILVGPMPTCPGANQICAINASLGSGGMPIITAGLKDEMVDALNMRTDYPNVLLKI